MGTADIGAQIRAILGRDATAPEIEFYNKFIQQENITPHEIGLMLQGGPEFQRQQLDRDISSYGAQLSASDRAILDQAGAAAQSRFASLGRPVTSSQVGALAQTAQSLAQQRQSALADFYGQGLNYNRNLAGNLGQGMLERGYGLRDESRQRAWQIEDRNYMKQAYDDYLNQQRRAQRSGALGSLGLGTVGALTGAYLGSYAGPGGTMSGARLGGSLGSQSGALFQ